jgi:AcrR family transcriptional regulator
VVHDDAPPTNYRDRHRAARRREFLDVARRLIEDEGQAALTLRRVTDLVGCSQAGIYNYFPTKDALVAELQKEAFEVLLQSYRMGRERLEAFLAGRKVPAVDAALANVLAHGAFWVDSDEALSSELELTGRMFGTLGDESTVESEIAGIATALLEEGRHRLEAAVAAGALAEGDNTQRALLLVSSVSGVLQMAKVGAWDSALADQRQLATSVSADILVGWGADRDALERADGHLAAFRAEHRIAPRPDVAA